MVGSEATDREKRSDQKYCAELKLLVGQVARRKHLSTIELPRAA